MKYRRLAEEELEEMRDEFVQFLAANGIPSEDWEKYRSEEPEKALGLIDEFSRIVLDKVLEKQVDIEHRTAKKLKVFRCGMDKIRLIGLNLPENSDHDLTDKKDLKNLMSSTGNGPFPELFQAEKAYDKDRKQEILEMLDMGCRLTRSSLFDTLEDLFQKS